MICFVLLGLQNTKQGNEYNCTKTTIIKYPQLTEISCVFLAFIATLPSDSTYSVLSVTVTTQQKLSPES